MKNGFFPISFAELKARLLAQTDSAMVSFIAVTEPDMKAKDKDGNLNQFRIGKGKTAVLTCCKLNKVNGNIASRYERVVENRLAKEIQEERTAEGLPLLTSDQLEDEIEERFWKGTSWHRPIPAADGMTCLSVNKKDPDGDNGKTYLRFIIGAKGQADYLRIENGEQIPLDEIKGFLSAPSSYENQGLSEENVVRFLCYALENIVEISIDGERFRIMDNFLSYPMTTRQRLWEICDEYLSGEKVMKKIS
jgi:hypothetical protein